MMMEEDEDYFEYVQLQSAGHWNLEARKWLQRKGGFSSFEEEEAEKMKLVEAKPSLLVNASQLEKWTSWD